MISRLWIAYVIDTLEHVFLASDSRCSASILLQLLNSYFIEELCQ